MRRLLPFLAVFLALACAGVSARADGLPERIAEVTQPLQGLMRKAASDPSPASVLPVVVALGLMPFLLVVPTTASCLLAGLILPWALAPWVILAGLLLNTVLSWSLARSVFGRRLEAWLERRGGTLGALRAHAKEGGVKWTFLARFVPAPFVGIPMVMASAGVPLRQVLLGTFGAMLPWSFLYAWMGKAGREGDLRSLGMAVTGIVLFSAFALWLRKRYWGAGERGAKP